MNTPIISEIARSGVTIYTDLLHKPDLYIDTPTLEAVLNAKLRGMSLKYPLRTRSKKLKEAVCVALGYPKPKSFQKTQPRFPGQNFDTYVQKSNNLQIWNEEVSPSRRYVLIRVNDDDIVTQIKVVTGEVLAALDKTGTLTHKYQARSRAPVTKSALASPTDTANTLQMASQLPGFIPIADLYNKLVKLEGATILNPGVDQERNRGGLLYDAIRELCNENWQDDGQFPDIKEQLLEVKLQTALTIDLGLVCPDSTEMLTTIPGFRHCDTRYAVVYGEIIPAGVRLNHIIVVTGEQFFTPFQKFGGNVKNAKLQIPLPSGFFANSTVARSEESEDDLFDLLAGNW